MGREVRMVTKEWQHPIDDKGYYQPLTKREMPKWTKEEAIYFQMYENMTEGTPISPAFKTKEELAQWLAETKASYFANHGATVEKWMNVIESKQKATVSLKIKI